MLKGRIHQFCQGLEIGYGTNWSADLSVFIMSVVMYRGHLSRVTDVIVPPDWSRMLGAKTYMICRPQHHKCSLRDVHPIWGSWDIYPYIELPYHDQCLYMWRLVKVSNSNLQFQQNDLSVSMSINGVLEFYKRD